MFAWINMKIAEELLAEAQAKGLVYAVAKLQDFIGRYEKTRGERKEKLCQSLADIVSEVRQVNYQDFPNWAAADASAHVGPNDHAMSLAAGDTRTIVLSPGINLQMVYCPPGTFVMGSPLDEQARRNDERQHNVTLTKGFWIGKYPITQRQWTSVMKFNPELRWKGDNVPVRGINWNICQEFCGKIGMGIRLPTEAEWEYACRAGTTGAYAGTIEELGWYDKTSGCKGDNPVCTKAPNPWGIYDMHGSVWELCQDLYGEYPSGCANDPLGPAIGNERVYRGGSWDDYDFSCRSASRDRIDQCTDHCMLGLRVACSAWK